MIPHASDIEHASPVGMKRRSTYWIATLVALGGAGLLIYWEQTARPMWVDEEMLTLNARDHAFSQLGGPLWLDQSVPLGWLALERLVLLTFGPGERAVRLVTVLGGIGTLMTGVWIGRRWMGPVGAVALVLLCSIGQWIVFFTLELKHYSADTLGALFLPGLGAWVLDGADGSSGLTRRVALWWTAAAVGLWFSNGALFVTPACAGVLLIECWRRSWRTAGWAIVAGLVWVASFALYYPLVLRPALGNPYLQNYWAFAFPPASGGVGGTLRWSFGQLAPFAIKPGGSGLWIVFWLASVFGIIFAIATRRALGLMLATVPFSAVALAVLHLVPPFERLVVWAVPAFYVGIGLCADAALWLGGGGYSRRRPVRFAFAVAAALISTIACVDIVRRGELALASRPRSNYGLDDRSSVRWLMRARRPGDVVMTTHFGLAALWWYGRVNISDPDRAGFLPDGTPILEVGHVPPGPECLQSELETKAALNGHSRVVVYLGFRLNVLPPGFDNLVLEDLGKRGALVGYQRYAEESRIAVFDLGRAPLGSLVIPGESTPLESSAPSGAGPPTPAGCLSVRPTVRW